MAINLDTNIAPSNGQKFWLLDTLFGKGGKVEADTFSDLDAIPLANRKQYMWGVDISTGNYYEADSSKAWQPLTFGSGDRVFKTITQTSHGFIKGDVIGFDGGTYVKVLATTADDTDAIGVVSRVIDVNNFDVTLSGYITLTGVNTYADNTLEGAITANTRYFLSYNTAGRLELNEPNLLEQIQKPVLITLSTTLGIVQIGTGAIITEDSDGASGYAVVEDEGSAVTQRDTINFVGAGVSVADTGGKTTVTIPGTSLGSFSGDISNGGTGNLVTTIVNNAVTNAKAADMATQTIKGRTTAGTGDPEDLTVAQVRTMLAIASGTTGTIPIFSSTTQLGNSGLVTATAFAPGDTIQINYPFTTVNSITKFNLALTIDLAALPTSDTGLALGRIYRVGNNLRVKI